MIYALILIAFFLLYKKLGEIGEKGRDSETPPEQPPEQPSDITWNDIPNAQNIRLVLIGGYKVELVLFHYWVYHNIYSIPLPDLLNFLNDWSFASGDSSFNIKIESSSTKLTGTYMTFEKMSLGGTDLGLPGSHPFNHNGWRLISINRFNLSAKDVKEGLAKIGGVVAKLLSPDGWKIFEWRNITLKLKLEKPA